MTLVTLITAKSETSEGQLHLTRGQGYLGHMNARPNASQINQYAQCSSQERTPLLEGLDHRPVQKNIRAQEKSTQWPTPGRDAAVSKCLVTLDKSYCEFKHLLPRQPGG